MSSKETTDRGRRKNTYQGPSHDNHMHLSIGKPGRQAGAWRDLQSSYCEDWYCRPGYSSTERVKLAGPRATMRRRLRRIVRPRKSIRWCV